MRAIKAELRKGIQPLIIDEIVDLLKTGPPAHGGAGRAEPRFHRQPVRPHLLIQKGRITREVSPGNLQDPDLIGEFVGVER